MVVNGNVEGGREIRTDGHHLLTPLQVPRSTTTALLHSRARNHARRSAAPGGGEHCGTPFFLSFNRCSTLDLMHPQNKHARRTKRNQNVPEEVGVWIHGELPRPSECLQARSRSCTLLQTPLSFPSIGVQTLRLCCAHQTRQAVNHTHWLCPRDLQGLLPRGCAFWG